TEFNEVCGTDFWLIPFWWNRLLQDLTFTEKLAVRWEELRATKLQQQVVHAYIDSVYAVLNAESQQRNFKAWNVLNKYVWPNYFIGFNFQDEVNWLKTWVTQRLGWLDQNIPLLITDTESETYTEGAVKVYPNPFSTKANFEYTLLKPGEVSIRIFDHLGRTVTEDMTEYKEAGTFIYSWETYASNGLYYYSVQQGREILGIGKLSKK
ncbi:MAG: hypothetical protein C0490_26920, partial [Marivirga sp.]|nr:hypothetical protein [Marivirga sp.]